MKSQKAQFGYPALWDSTFDEHKSAFLAIEKLRDLARKLALAMKDSNNELVQVLNSLMQICSDSMVDVVLLTGNKRGSGAMKIARGMFEIAVISSYLEKNPNEVDKYLDFALVESWRHLQAVERHTPGRVPPELMREAEAEHNRVKPKFLDKRGRVGWRWTDKSVKKLAEEVDRLPVYEIAYSLASELHHMPLTGIIGHELNWEREALYVAHGSLMDTVLSLANQEAGTSFREPMATAIADFHSTWKRA